MTTTKNEQPTMALAVQDRSSISRPSNFSPETLSEAMEFSKLIANSDLAPKDFKGKPGNVLIAIQMGAEVGLAPMQAIQNIAVINGRPSLWGDAALAVVQAHQSYEWHKEKLEGEGDAKVAVFEIKRKGHEAHVSKFSMADAKKAKLFGKEGPWQTYPDRMLQMRARGFGLRDKFADALRGLNIAEEAMDIPEQEATRPALAEVTEHQKTEDDPALRQKAIELMSELGLNEAQREMRLSKWAGDMPGLIAQIEKSIATAQRPSSSNTAAETGGAARGRVAQEKAPDPAPKPQPDPLQITDEDRRPPAKTNGGFGF